MKMSREVFDRAVIAHNIIFTTVRAAHDRHQSRKLGRRNGAVHEIDVKAAAVTPSRSAHTATSMVPVFEAGEREEEEDLVNVDVDVDDKTESRAFVVADIS